VGRARAEGLGGVLIRYVVASRPGVLTINPSEVDISWRGQPLVRHITEGAISYGETDTAVVIGTAGRFDWADRVVSYATPGGACSTAPRSSSWAPSAPAWGDHRLGHLQGAGIVA
jgi:hypothetical protein